MKIKNQISFGKKLIAKCMVKELPDKNVPCNIYKLNTKEDSDYFIQVTKDPKWEGNSFLDIVKEIMLTKYLSKHCTSYSLENQSGECLGFVNISSLDENDKKTYLQYLETCPEYSSKNKKRGMKYIGQSLLAFVTELAKRNDKQKICISAYTDRAKSFYRRNCGFKQDKDGADGLVLEKKDFSAFIEQHKKETGSSIEFIA